jgi:hypothetical protein
MKAASGQISRQPRPSPQVATASGPRNSMATERDARDGGEEAERHRGHGRAEHQRALPLLAAVGAHRRAHDQRQHRRRHDEAKEGGGGRAIGGDRRCGKGRAELDARHGSKAEQNAREKPRIARAGNCCLLIGHEKPSRGLTPRGGHASRQMDNGDVLLQEN